MSAKERVAALQLYRGSEGFIYEDEGYIISITNEESAEHPMFYEVVKWLSTVVALGFAVLLGLSFIIGGPIHWAISAVGCLGSIGFTGAVWLSRPYLKRRDIQ